MLITTTNLGLYFETLLGNEPDCSLINIRVRPRGKDSMRQWFVEVGARDALHSVFPVLARRADIYVGVAPRCAPRGTRDAVTHAHVAWVDLDGPDGAARAASFEPHPTLVVRSGSPGGVHAYWSLDRATDATLVEQINRALAETLAGDPVWAATTILRPPGTLNHKSGSPRMVELVRATGEVFAPETLLSALPTIPPPPVRVDRPRVENADQLLRIPPRVYVATLLATEVPRSGFVSCPFHRDRHPSLRVYDTPERGWCCYGRCGRRGGTIYDLAGRLWRLDTRGEQFLEIRRRLIELFGAQ